MHEDKTILLEEAKVELAKRDRHFGVLLEDLDDKWKCVSEGLETLDKKIDQHYAEFREFRTETNEKFDILFEFRGETRENFKTLFDYIKASDEDKADKREVAILECRVTRVENI